ncbi:MAG: hypothetical protein DMF97_10880 [Acidobacteria bacterium]|nr:MAG: hypothetical protein DMF97_10880 [Acidobacteriota bacterium]
MAATGSCPATWPSSPENPEHEPAAKTALWVVCDQPTPPHGKTFITFGRSKAGPLRSSGLSSLCGRCSEWLPRRYNSLSMKKQVIAAVAVSVLAVVMTSAQAKRGAAPGARQPFTVVEATIPEMRAAMEQGRVTSHELVQQYLTRIATYEDKLHAALTVNPHALEEADARDRDRASGRTRGPLHGIPIALKDNIHTTDMPTTGGALAFEGFVPPYEATLTKNLRDAGAIIIAKTGLTELANWVAGGPTPMPGNYNAVGGFGYNPYDPRKDPRDATFDGRPVLGTGGSSSGIGTAANFWAGNVGSETSGSILSPSNQNMLAAIKPTVGRISRYGVIPITADQDTAGPMAKSVSDVAIMLGALESASPDPNDAATRTCTPPPGRDYTKFLNRNGLKGARIGIPRAFFYDRVTPPGGAPSAAAAPGTPGESTARRSTLRPFDGLRAVPSSVEGRQAQGRPEQGRGGRGSGRPEALEGRGGLNDDQKKVMDDAMAVLRKEGAVIVDPADIPSVVDKDTKNNFMTWGMCSGADNAKGKDADCSVVLKYGMKRDFNKWLASLGSAPVVSLTALREWEGGRDQVRPVEPRYLGRDGRRGRPRAI